MLVIEKIDNFERFLSMRKEWNELLSHSESDNFYLTHEWLSVWWKNLGYDKQLLILCVKEGSDILALAPLMISRGTLMKLPVKKIEFIGAGWGYGGFILIKRKEECLREIFKYLIKSKISHLFVLSRLANSESEVCIMQKELKLQKALFLIEETSVPAVSLQDGWESYISSRSQGFRKRIRRIENKFSRDGGVVLERVKQGHSIAEDMENIFSISLKSWKAKDGSAIASSMAIRNLYSDLAEELYKVGWLDLSLQKLGVNKTCYLFAAIYGKKYYGIDTAFDLEFATYSPGIYSIYSLLRQLFNDGVELFDFVMDHPYKKLFSNCEIKHVDLYIFKYSPSTYFLFILRAVFFPKIRKWLEHRQEKKSNGSKNRGIHKIVNLFCT